MKEGYTVSVLVGIRTVAPETDEGGIGTIGTVGLPAIEAVFVDDRVKAVDCGSKGNGGLDTVPKPAEEIVVEWSTMLEAELVGVPTDVAPGVIPKIGKIPASPDAALAATDAALAAGSKDESGPALVVKVAPGPWVIDAVTGPTCVDG